MFSLHQKNLVLRFLAIALKHASGIWRTMLFAALLLLAPVAMSAYAAGGSGSANGLKEGSQQGADRPAFIRAFNVPTEEMVAGFIVKPHHRTGRKLRSALQAHDARALSHTAKVELTVKRAMSDDGHVLRLSQPIPLSEARAVATRLMRDGSVAHAEPDRIMFPATFIPNDPGYSFQWHYAAPAGSNKGGANLPYAWDVTLGSTSVVVAVLDTGIRQHTDLATVLAGYDFITSSSTANDGGGRDSDAADPGDWVAANECYSGSGASNSSWHGTHVAGTIAALMNNGTGVTGVAPNVKILPVRVLGKCGGTTSDIADAMRWAAGLSVPGIPNNPNPAKVLNLSLGGSGSCSAAFQSAVNDVVNAGKVVVVAAGNNASSTVTQPANCNGVIAVTAHSIDGDNANYANIGPEVTISAPGGGCGTMTTASTCTSFYGPNGDGVYSLGNTGGTTPGSDTYSLMMGTSMAAPHVSGVVALMFSLDPSLTPAQVASNLRSSARPHPSGSACLLSSNVGKCGAGLLDARAALNMTSPILVISNSPQLVAPGSSVTLSGSAVASSGHTFVSYQWTPFPGNPSSVTLSNANTATASFTAPATGVYSFTLTATESGTGNVVTANATVRVNSAPVLTAISTQQVSAGDTLQFSVGATDIDGDTLIFNAVDLPAGASLSAGGVLTWPSASPAGSYRLAYYASDGYANSAQASVSINVTAAPGGGGGGSMDDESLIALAVLAACLRMRRALHARAARHSIETVSMKTWVKRWR